MNPRLAAALGLLVLVGAVYAPLRDHAFVAYDDAEHVVENPMLLEPLSLASIAAAFRPYHSNWIPLTFLSLQVDRAIWGEGPLGHLVGNVILHSVGAFLLFVALVRATRAGGASPAIGRCFFVAAVFAVHPLHVESVAWVSERKDVLSGAFFAATLLLWTRYAEHASVARYAAAALALALGLMAKPVLVTVPCLLVLFDAWPLGRLRSRRDLPQLVFEKIPLLALGLGASIVTCWVQADSGATWVVPPPLADRIRNAIDASAWYVVKTAWPQGLAVFYPYPDSISLSRTLGALALLLGLSGAAVATVRRHTYGIVGWLWFLGMLVPMSGLVQVGMQSRADRYSYLPQIGLTIALAWGAVAAAAHAGRARRALPALAALCVVALAVVARQQVHVWSDTRSLFEHARAVTGPNFQAERALARLAWLAEDFEESERRYRASLAAQPDWAETHLDLANLLRTQGRRAQAIRHYRFASELDRGSSRAPAALASLLIEQKRHTEAEHALEIALQRDPRNADLHANMAVVAFAQGDLAKAIRSAREALAIDSAQTSAATTLSWLLARHPDPKQRDASQAIAVAEKALASTSEFEHRLLGALAAGYAAAGRAQEAEATATRALAQAEERGDEDGIKGLRTALGFYRMELRRLGLERSRPDESGEPSATPGTGSAGRS